jgi:hypothetical protein
LFGKLEGKMLVGRSGVDGKTILKQILKTYFGRRELVSAGPV